MKKLSNEWKVAFSECDFLISIMDDNLKNRIPEKFKAFLKENKLQGYFPEINENVSIEQQKFTKETNAVMAVIYLKYLCDSEEERMNLLKKLKNNNK